LVHKFFEEEKEDIHEVFEWENTGEPIYEEEYVPTNNGEFLIIGRSIHTPIDRIFLVETQYLL